MKHWLKGLIAGIIISLIPIGYLIYLINGFIATIDPEAKVMFIPAFIITGLVIIGTILAGLIIGLIVQKVKNK